jgi:alpha-beta hydrolase superfamily lysophospholipase
MAMLSAQSRGRLIDAAILTASMLGLPAGPAGAQQTRLAKVPLSALAAQGFEVKAAAGNQAGVIQTLVLQKEEQVFLCDSKDLSIDPVVFECWRIK